MNYLHRISVVLLFLGIVIPAILLGIEILNLKSFELFPFIILIWSITPYIGLLVAGKFIVRTKNYDIFEVICVLLCTIYGSLAYLSITIDRSDKIGLAYIVVPLNQWLAIMICLFILLRIRRGKRRLD
jgi:hypothetical protein